MSENKSLPAKAKTGLLTAGLDLAKLDREFARSAQNRMAPVIWITHNLMGKRCSLESCYDLEP